jgi:simple sugar transport system ATP-binding protein
MPVTHEPRLRFSDVTVTFPGVLACSSVSLDVMPGEVHAVVGENGAGKSTLMHVAAGTVRAAAGHLEVDGSQVRIRNPGDARQCGIAMVFQKFLLVEPLTGLQNVLLGTRGYPLWSTRRGQRRLAAEVSEGLGIDVPLDRPVGTLSAGERQKVALMRALYRNARVLILDEPTAVLTPGEVAQLAAHLTDMRSRGLSVFLVSHRLGEVLSMADVVSVMRRGMLVESRLPAKDISASRLASLMVGGELGRETSSSPTKPLQESNPVIESSTHPAVEGVSPPHLPEDSVTVLDLDHVWAGDGEHQTLEDVTLTLHSGEILAVVGVSGNGQGLVADVCSGLAGRTRGALRLLDATAPPKPDPGWFIRRNTAYVSQDRYFQSSDPGLSLQDTFWVKDHREKAGRLGILDQAGMTGEAGDACALHDVRHAGMGSLCGSLSGGNLQKLILARELRRSPSLLVVHDPTQGLDIRASRFIHQRIFDEVRRGAGVLLVTSDLDEALALAHNLVVLYRGRIVARFGREEFRRERIGRAMAGLKLGEDAA